MLEAVEYAENNGLIANNATWQVSCGEITIHPFKERIYYLVRGKRVYFYTNAFIYDENIAQSLNSNPYACINVSLDSGTANTWKKVKGVDNFETVVLNLIKYYRASVRPNQITLKYIVLPGINDIYEDYISLMEIMKLLEVSHLSVSRDTSIKYSNKRDEEYRDLIGAAAYLVAICHKNGFTFDLFTYKVEEREEIVILANEILSSGNL